MIYGVKGNLASYKDFYYNEDMENRDQKIIIRLTEEEVRRVDDQADAAGMDRSAYIRTQLRLPSAVSVRGGRRAGAGRPRIGLQVRGAESK